MIRLLHSPGLKASRSMALLALALAPACNSVVSRPLPDPLPTTLEWALAPAPEGLFLGLTVRENDSGSLEALAFDPGVRVTAVASGSPADEAGMRIGDVLLSLDQIQIHDPGELENLLAETQADSATTRVVQAQVQRGDSIFDVALSLRTTSGQRSPATRLWRADPARSQAGWLAGRGGVVLVTSAPDGPFPKAGIPVGSVVTAVDGQPVRSDLDLVQRLQAAPEGQRIDIDFVAADAPSNKTRSVRVKLARAPRRITSLGMPVVLNYSSDPEGTRSSFVLIDLWLISLFRYERDGTERRWSFLRFFSFSTGIGELAS